MSKKITNILENLKNNVSLGVLGINKLVIENIDAILKTVSSSDKYNKNVRQILFDEIYDLYKQKYEIKIFQKGEVYLAKKFDISQPAIVIYSVHQSNKNNIINTVCVYVPIPLSHSIELEDSKDIDFFLNRFNLFEIIDNTIFPLKELPVASKSAVSEFLLISRDPVSCIYDFTLKDIPSHIIAHYANPGYKKEPINEERFV